MYDSGKIIAGLIIFVGLFTSPIWYDISNGKEALKEPNLVLPTKENQQECIRSASYMRSYHMEMLNDWRYEVVREGKRNFVSNNGKTYDMSLTKTCLNCHSNKAQFCDQCHDYVGVSPYCWECHLEPHNPESK